MKWTNDGSGIERTRSQKSIVVLQSIATLPKADCDLSLITKLEGFREVGVAGHLVLLHCLVLHQHAVILLHPRVVHSPRQQALQCLLTADGASPLLSREERQQHYHLQPRIQSPHPLQTVHQQSHLRIVSIVVLDQQSVHIQISVGLWRHLPRVRISYVKENQSATQHTLHYGYELLQEPVDLTSAGVKHVEGRVPNHTIIVIFVHNSLHHVYCCSVLVLVSGKGSHEVLGLIGVEVDPREYLDEGVSRAKRDEILVVPVVLMLEYGAIVLAELKGVPAGTDVGELAGILDGPVVARLAPGRHEKESLEARIINVLLIVCPQVQHVLWVLQFCLAVLREGQSCRGKSQEQGGEAQTQESWHQQCD